MDSSTLGARGRVLPVARHAFSLAGIAGAVAGAMLGGKVPALAAESDPASQQAQATPDAAPAPQPSGPQGAATPTFEEVTTTARQRAENDYVAANNLGTTRVHDTFIFNAGYGHLEIDEGDLNPN